MKPKPSSLEIGMWVYDTDNKVHKITADDMPDLTYDQIAGLLEDNEIPEFSFYREQLSDNYNLENFFNPLLKVHCPQTLEAFCKWVDGFKWGYDWEKILDKRIKFHDLPFALQFGMFIDFFTDTISRCGFTLNDDINWAEQSTVDDFIVDTFIFIEVELRNGQL